MTEANPILVDVTRGGHAESRHRGACAIVAANGAVLRAWGDVDRPVYPRSAIKPIQALPLLESGAADRFAFTEEEVALACASHNSEAGHVERVLALLRRLGLGEGDLECGPHDPINIEVMKAHCRAGHEMGRAHNNCSGKHAGFLAVALHLGAPTQGYVLPGHPVQQRVSAAIAEMSGAKLADAPAGTDGCGIPVFGIPLRNLARAMARMTADDLPAPRLSACRRILAAMGAHPYLVAGAERADTRIMQATGGRVVSKMGAEGVHVAVVTERKLAVALKIDDGASRAAEVAMCNILDGLGVFDASARAALSDLLVKPVLSTRGVPVGDIRKGPGL